MRRTRRWQRAWSDRYQARLTRRVIGCYNTCTCVRVGGAPFMPVYIYSTGCPQHGYPLRVVAR